MADRAYNSNMSFTPPLPALRTLMKQHGIDAYLVPHRDAYDNEALPASEERIAFLSGFTGSFGLCVVTTDKALLISDSRYTLQMRDQTDSVQWDVLTLNKKLEEMATEWLEDRQINPLTIGYDPLMIPVKQLNTLHDEVQKVGGTLKPIMQNLVDLIWTDRPLPPSSPVYDFPLEIAGIKRDDKLEQVTDILNKTGGGAYIFTQPGSICWLLNIRGSDVPETPFPLSRGILHASGRFDWFVNAAQLPNDLDLGARVQTFAPDLFEDALIKLAQRSHENKPILLSSNDMPSRYWDILQKAEAKTDFVVDPVRLPRACKNPSEIEGMRQAHLLDGIALVKFHKWLTAQFSSGAYPDEIKIEAQLASYRGESDAYLYPSFETIAGFAGNGAIVHYRANSETCKKLSPGSLLLVDSGGQYKSGTTDVTRTYATGGTIADDIKRHYTIVLKSHIAVAVARFPKGTRGHAMDTLAQNELWKHGYKCEHGIGHGVGCAGSVHEWAANFSPRTTEAIAAGMIISNEPGLYFSDRYGIRLENLVLVNIADEQGFMDFETLTLAPFDTTLILPEMLDEAEKEWLNTYHTYVCDRLSPHLDSDTATWLKEMTIPIP